MKLNLKIVAAVGAVTMMSSSVAFAAASITVPPPGLYTYSKEGLSLTTAAGVALPDITVTFGNNLTYQDDILITLPGTVSVAAVPSPTLVVCAPATSAVGYVTTVAGGWNFRVTSVTGVNLGDSCTFSGLQVTPASLSTATGEIDYKALRFQTGQLVDQANTKNAIQVKSQFALTTQQKLNGIIDVNADRKTFAALETVAPGAAAAPAGYLNDTLNFTTTVDGSGLVFTAPTVAPTATKIEIVGDWSWVDGSDTGATCDLAEFGAVLNGYAGWTASSSSDCSKLVLNQTYPLAANTTAMTGFVDIPGTVALNPTDWVGTVEWSYVLTGGSATGKTGLTWDPGAWTINGAQVYIQYMPWGTNISRIIYAANSGVQTGSVTGTIYYNGNTYTCNLGSAPAKTVTELSGPVNTCVANAGITSGKVAILLTFTAPDKDIEVYSAYNVGGDDRGTVVNTSNGRTFFYGTGFPFVPPGP
jgi:hypothetical protein